VPLKQRANSILGCLTRRIAPGRVKWLFPLLGTHWTASETESASETASDLGPANTRQTWVNWSNGVGRAAIWKGLREWGLYSLEERKRWP